VDSAIAETSVVVADKDVFSCELAGGRALLDLRTSTYYSINKVGTHDWELLKEPVPVSDIERSVTEAFEVDSGRARADILALLDQFARAGLIQVRDEQPH
jgi:hypothetical protein